MTIRPSFRVARYACLALLIASHFATAAAPSPAQPVHHAEPVRELAAAPENYEAFRRQYSEVVWGHKPASSEQLQQFIAYLEQGFGRAKQPVMGNLGQGLRHYRHQRFNVLTDLVKLYTRADQPERALNVLREMAGFQWAADGLFADEPKFAKVQALPGYAEVRHVLESHAGWSDFKSLKTPYQPQLSEAERLAGLARIKTVVSDGFVGFADPAAKLAWDAAYTAAMPQVIAAKDTATYYEILDRLVARLQDGKSYVDYPEALQSRYFAETGIRTRRLDDKVVVSSIMDAGAIAQGVRAGDELVSIDGVPVLEYGEQRVAPFVSASTKQDREIQTYAYSLLAGDAKVPVKLTLRNEVGETYTFTAARADFEFALPPPKEPVFKLRDDGVAVLRVRTLEDDSALKALRANVGVLANAKGLILDLRGNTGGATYYGTEILKYLTREPLPAARVSSAGAAKRGASAGSSPISLEWPESSRSPDSNLPAEHFDGQVALLIDARTAGAAEHMATVFKLMKRGMIVGRPSSGNSGRPYVFGLPGGGMARITVERDEYVDGSNFAGVGVQPDLFAQVVEEDFREREDYVRDLAVSMLLLKQAVGYQARR